MEKQQRILPVPPVTPMPPEPDASLYQHLSQIDRMLGGFPYNPFDPEVLVARRNARVIQRRFNDAINLEERREVLRELLHPAFKDNKIYLESYFRVDYGRNIILGDNFQGNVNIVILDCAGVEIGDNCLFGPNVQLFPGTHSVDAATRQGNDDYYELAYPIKIGDNCWFGGMSAVLPGVTIGNNVVVGAGTVVTRDVPDNCVVAGNPAKVIRLMPPREIVTPKRKNATPEKPESFLPCKMASNRRIMAVPQVTPIPPQPDNSLYQDLTEMDRMLRGFPYKPWDPELIAVREKARDLQRQFNSIAEENAEQRREILRKLLHPASKDNKILIEPNFRMDYGQNVIIGENFRASFNMVILDGARVEIGDNCIFGPNVQLYPATHSLDAATRQDNEDYYELAYPIKIGDNCWFGGLVVVLPGVTIGNNVVVGAGSVVSKDVPDNCVVAGNPAKVIRHMLPPQISPSQTFTREYL